MKHKNTIKKYWERININPENDCWEWEGCKTPEGYGMFGMNYKVYLTHRLAWEINNGEIPKDKCVLHKCDNPKCCNPDHLFLGTRQDNIKDRSNKERGSRGEKTNRNKLTEEEVVDIKTLYEQGETQRELGRIYGIHHLQIHKIVNGKSWRHLNTSPPKPIEKNMKKKLGLVVEYDEEGIPEECISEE